MSYNNKKIIKWVGIFFGFSLIYYLYKNGFFNTVITTKSATTGKVIVTEKDILEELGIKKDEK